MVKLKAKRGQPKRGSRAGTGRGNGVGSCLVAIHSRFPLTLTGAVTTFAGGAGVIGSTDATGTAARFNNLHDITTDGANLYVADVDNHIIRRVVIATGAVTTIAGSAGVAGSTDAPGAAARFNGGYCLTTDGTSLYVADNGNHTIRKIQ